MSGSRQRRATRAAQHTARPLSAADAHGPHIGGHVATRTALNTDANNARQRSWLEFQHPFYSANVDRWIFARDHYTGAVLDDGKITTYLVKRAAGETDAQYKERQSLADYTNHYAQVIESLAGRLFAVEGDANRRFTNDAGVGLGDPTNPRTVIGKLWRRADADGNGYLTVWKQLAIELCITPYAWVMVDVVRASPVLRILPPSMVPNWWEGPNGPELVLAEEVDSRTAITDAPVFGIQYVHMTVQGWQRYTIDPLTGTERPLADDFGRGTWRYQTPEGLPALPIFRVQLPMRRNVGYLLAKKASAIFNMESSRDNNLRNANHARLVLAADDDAFDTITDDLSAGANTIQENPAVATNGHRFIAPDVAPSTVATETIKEKVKDFHETAHRDYDNAARPAQRTATQVNQDVQSGEGAFLQLLKAGLDDAENNALWRIEQAVKPDETRFWFVSSVERSDNFMPKDPDSVQEKSAGLVFGKDKPVPMGRQARLELVRDVANQRGLVYDENEAAAAVSASVLEEAIANATANGLVVPDVVKMLHFLCNAAAAGVIDAEAANAALAANRDVLLQLIQAATFTKPSAAALAPADAAMLPTDGGGAGDGVGGGRAGVVGDGLGPESAQVGTTPTFVAGTSA